MANSENDLKKMGLTEVAPGIWKRVSNKNGKIKSQKRNNGFEFTKIPDETQRILEERSEPHDVRLNVEPMSKPRMTSSDKWKKRDVVLRYRAYKDTLRAETSSKGFKMAAAGMHIIFHIRMPKSWNQKKKKEMAFKPHQQDPDIDNLIKGFFDALESEDNFVYDVRGTKVWDYRGFIEVDFTKEEETE